MQPQKAKLALEDMPMQYDHWFSSGEDLEKRGKWDVAARMFRYCADVFGNLPYMLTKEANALYQFGDYHGALQVLSSVTRPTVSTYLIEARCYKALDKPEKACIIYEKAKTILERK